jgi:YVTN family beta-propeller protein
MGKVGWPADQRARRLLVFGVPAAVVALVVAGLLIFGSSGSAPQTAAPAPASASASAQATRASAGSASPTGAASGAGSASPTRSASSAASPWTVAGPVADLSEPLPGMPPVTDPANIYAAAGANMLSPAARLAPYRIYVPNSGGSTVTVINPATYKVIRTFQTGLNPQHVVPGYGMRTLYVTNDLGNSLTPINPMTGRPSGKNIAVDDPYNMYYTPDGQYAIVVAEGRQNLDFRDPHTFALEHRIHVNCAGVDHIDFAATGAYLIATCEFGGRLVRVDLHTLKVVDYLNLPGSAPQDIKLDPAGRIFYVADKNHGGVWLVNAATFTLAGFIPTGPDAHGLYPSRDASTLYVTNRGNGTITLISFATRKKVTTWRIPGGGSPDMGNLSPDGKVFWVSGRYNDVVYAIRTSDGHLLAKIGVGIEPHGLCVWPQPGRYSLGHTGITR